MAPVTTKPKKGNPALGFCPRCARQHTPFCAGLSCSACRLNPAEPGDKYKGLCRECWEVATKPRPAMVAIPGGPEQSVTLLEGPGPVLTPGGVEFVRISAHASARGPRQAVSGAPGVFLDPSAPGGTPLPELGRKYDSGKEPWNLIPVRPLRFLVAVLAFGARKYAPENWRLVPDWRNRYFAAACRHLWAWFEGERLDPETGLPHLAHCACCIFFLLELDSAQDKG